MKYRLVNAGGNAAAAPVLSSITPNSGNQNSSVPVTIVGSGFTPSTTLLFGDPNVTAGALTITSTQITTTLSIAAGAVLGTINVFAQNTGSPISNALTFQNTLAIFADSLTRAVGGWGPNWLMTYQDFTQAGGNLLNECVPTNTGLAVASTGGGSADNVAIIPLPLVNAQGLTQFAEMEFLSRVGGPFMGPCVAFSGNSPFDAAGPQNGYFFGFQVALTRMDLYVSNVGLRAIQTNVCPLAANDVMRLAVQFGTPAGNNTITCYRNGTLVGTFTDNNAARPTTGIPCIFVSGFELNTSMNTALFRGGLGLGT